MHLSDQVKGWNGLPIRTVCTDRISSSRSVDDPSRLQFTDRLHRLQFVHTDCTNCKTALTDRILSCLMGSPHCYTINSLDIFFCSLCRRPFLRWILSAACCRRCLAEVKILFSCSAWVYKCSLSMQTMPGALQAQRLSLLFSFLHKLNIFTAQCASGGESYWAVLSCGAVCCTVRCRFNF